VKIYWKVHEGRIYKNNSQKTNLTDDIAMVPEENPHFTEESQVEGQKKVQ